MKKETNKSLFLIIVILLLLLVSMGGYFIYNNSFNNCSSGDKNSEKTNALPSDNKKEYTYTNSQLAAKYTNLVDNNQYIVFKEDGTWESSLNNCEYLDHAFGTYVIDNNKVILEYDGFSGKPALTIESSYGSYNDLKPILLLNKEESLPQCIQQDYYIRENIDLIFE